MNRYRVEFSSKASKTMLKLDSTVSRMIYGWIDKNLDQCIDPRAHGKALTGNLSGLWRYRVGNYRLIAEIRDDRLVILMIDVGHRSEIYN